MQRIMPKHSQFFIYLKPIEPLISFKARHNLSIVKVRTSSTQTLKVTAKTSAKRILTSMLGGKLLSGSIDLKVNSTILDTVESSIMI